MITTTHIPAVNNNPMQFSDRSGGVSRRRVILPFPEVIPANERDPQLLAKITGELAVIVRHLMQRFAAANDARVLLEAQQNSDEALEIKRSADPLVDFCGYLLASVENLWLKSRKIMCIVTCIFNRCHLIFPLFIIVICDFYHSCDLPPLSSIKTLRSSQ